MVKQTHLILISIVVLLLAFVIGGMIPGIPGFIAGDTTTDDMKEGTIAKASTEITMDKGMVTFTDKANGLSASTTTTINGVAFVPAKTTEGKELEWTTGETNVFLQPDPVVKMVYSYDGKTLKETITLKEDRVLTFPITLSTYSKLIPWDNGQWKIVATNSFNTMKGIVLEKPYGIDANGKRIEMEYTYDKGVLTLVYDRTITEYVREEKEVIVIDNKTGLERTEIEVIYVPKYSPITYPLVIDPTWVAIDGHWIDSTSNATHTVEMWNATGTTNWTLPVGVTSVEYLVIAGGGAGAGNNWDGGGGGAGGFWGGTLTGLTGSQTVNVGAGGSGRTNLPGLNGTSSTFSNITAIGGGGGGTNAGIVGGSGGGGGGDAGSGAATVDAAHGNKGGNAASNSAGGGGGAGGVGGNGNANSNGGIGGIGKNNSIIGISTCYAGGGGGAAYYVAGGTATCGGGAGVTGANNGVNATANTGGGGGGGNGNGGTSIGGYGGSGIVIIKYLTPLTVAPTASFVIILTDTSTGTSLSWQWNVTNLLGNNTEVTFSTSQHTNMTLGQGNWLVKLTATNSLGSSSATKYIGLNLSSPLVYFWNRTG